MIDKKIGEEDLTFPILSILERFGAQTMSGLKNCFKNSIEVGGDNLSRRV